MKNMLITLFTNVHNMKNLQSAFTGIHYPVSFTVLHSIQTNIPQPTNCYCQSIIRLQLYTTLGTLQCYNLFGPIFPSPLPIHNTFTVIHYPGHFTALLSTIHLQPIPATAVHLSKVLPGNLQLHTFLTTLQLRQNTGELFWDWNNPPAPTDSVESCFCPRFVWHMPNWQEVDLFNIAYSLPSHKCSFCSWLWVITIRDRHVVSKHLHCVDSRIQ